MADMGRSCHHISCECMDVGMMQYTFDSFEGRFSGDLSFEARRNLHATYMKMLDASGIAESTDLYRYFVHDVFYCTRLRRNAISIGVDELGVMFTQLELRNEYANQQCKAWYRERFTEANDGNPLSAEHFEELLRKTNWDADDFYTKVTFRGIDKLEFDMHENDWCYCDYRYNTILSRDGCLNIALYFTSSSKQDARLSFCFDTLIVEDISPRLRLKYVGWTPRLYRGVD